MRPSMPKSAPYAGLAGVVVVIILAYLPGLGVYFVADDFRYLEIIRRFQSLADVQDYLQAGWSATMTWPAVSLIFWISHALAGLEPALYRSLTLAMHLASVLLVFLLVRRVAGEGGGGAALAAAAVVACHPRQHEGIMWLAAAGTMLVATISLAAACCYVVWRKTGQRVWLAASASAAFLAALIHPIGIVVPVLLAAYDLLSKDWSRDTVADWILIAILSLLALALAGDVARVGPGRGAGSYGLWLARGPTHVPVFLTYIWWPVPLDLKRVLEAQPLLFYAVTAATILAVGLLAFALVRRGNLLMRWGLVWTLVATLPPALFSAYLADRYMPTLLAGVALICAGVVQQASGRRRLVLVVLLLWSALALAQVHAKVSDWQVAGNITAAVRDETLARYPTVEDGQRFFYIGLPDMRNRCVIWSYGIASAVQVWYNSPKVTAARPLQLGVRSEPRPTDIILDFSGRWPDQ